MLASLENCQLISDTLQKRVLAVCSILQRHAINAILIESSVSITKVRVWRFHNINLIQGKLDCAALIS